MDSSDFTKLKLETRKMIADIEHNIKQQMHWTAQKWYWATIATVAAFALVAKPFLDGWAKIYFGA